MFEPVRRHEQNTSQYILINYMVFFPGGSHASVTSIRELYKREAIVSKLSETEMYSSNRTPET